MDPISSRGGGEEGQPRQPKPPPDSGGIHIGDVGGSVNFSALGDIVGGDKITTINTTIQISVEAITQRPLITASPYRGLDRFEDRDKDLFFGRDQLIKSLLAQLSASNVLLVLGASGSGKSSVVRAGLLPQLAQLIGARFRYFTFVPDVNPFESLRSALQGAGFSQTQTRELTEAKAETPSNLIHTLQRNDEQWLFFVDQFEEMFTVGDEKLRASFIAALVAIAQDPNSSAKLVLAMRADFLDRFSPFPQFAKIIEKNIDFVADMHTDELRQAIEQPAARHGVIFEQGLVEEIIKDVQGQAGSLPLLQYTLDLLWQEEAREDGLADRHLNTRAYRELGGVRGALQKRADEIYASFGDSSDAKAPTPKQEIVRQIFLRLVDLAGEGSNDAAWRPVRRRASMTMFTAAQEQEILQALINQKLLVSNREGDDATVEVAHEALFTSWGRLKNWIDAGKQVIFARNRLADDARRWQRRQEEGDAGADEELLSGSRLAQALDMRARGDFVTVVGGLGETETQFLDTSAAARDRHRQEEQERQQRELAQAQALAAEQKKRGDDQAKAAARLRRFTYAMVGVSLLAVAAAVFAWAKQQEAAQHARIALSRELAAAATHTSDAERRVILAREAVEATYSVDKTVTTEAAEVLRNSVPPEPITLQFGHKEAISAMAFSPDGTRLATGDEKMVKIWDISSRDELLIPSGDTSPPNPLRDSERRRAQGRFLAWSDDGGRLLAVEGDKAKVWDSHSGNELSSARTDEDFRDVRRKKTSEGFYVRLALNPEKEASSPDGKWLATIGDTSVTVKEVSTDKEVRQFTTGDDHLSAVGFSPDGKRLVIISGEIGKSSIVRIWNIADSSSTPIAQSDFDDTVVRIAFSPHSNRVAIASEKRNSAYRDNFRYFGPSNVRVIDVPSNREVFRLPPQPKPISVAFSPDGTLITADDEKVQLWDAAGQFAATFPGRYFGVVSLDGKRLASPGEDGTAKVWDIASPSREELANLSGQNEVKLNGVTFNPDSKRIATAGSDERVRLWDVSSGRTLLNIVPKQRSTIDVLVYSPEGKRLATGGMDGEAKVFDATSGSEIRKLPGRARILSAAFSPDGARLLTGSYGSHDPETAKVWELSSDKPPKVLIRDNSDSIFGVAFSPDGRHAVTSGITRPAKVWDVGSRSEPFKELFLLAKSGKDSRGIAYSPDGKQIATTTQVWDAATGNLLFTIPESHAGRIGSVQFAFSRDARRLATVVDQFAKVWDLASQKVPSTLDKPLTIDNGVAVRSLAFTADGKFLAAIGDDWTVRLHPLEIEGLINLARQRVPRELSADERRNYLHTK
jgi:WD40 repeat protein